MDRKTPDSLKLSRRVVAALAVVALAAGTGGCKEVLAAETPEVRPAAAAESTGDIE